MGFILITRPWVFFVVFFSGYTDKEYKEKTMDVDSGSSVVKALS